MNEFFLFCSQLWLLVKGFHFVARVAPAAATFMATGPSPPPPPSTVVAAAAAAAGAGAGTGAALLFRAART